MSLHFNHLTNDNKYLKCLKYLSSSLPSEVCTVISDADCITPVETICSAATPSPDCQMILRQFFNDSGVFCINVSLTNDVSLAVASARVSVTVGGWKKKRIPSRLIYRLISFHFTLIYIMCFDFSLWWFPSWNRSHSPGCYGSCLCRLLYWFDVQVSTLVSRYSNSVTSFYCRSFRPFSHGRNLFNL